MATNKILTVSRKLRKIKIGGCIILTADLREIVKEQELETEKLRKELEEKNKIINDLDQYDG